MKRALDHRPITNVVAAHIAVVPHIVVPHAQDVARIVQPNRCRSGTTHVPDHGLDVADGVPTIQVQSDGLATQVHELHINSKTETIHDFRGAGQVPKNN